MNDLCKDCRWHSLHFCTHKEAYIKDDQDFVEGGRVVYENPCQLMRQSGSCGPEATYFQINIKWWKSCLQALKDWISEK